LISNTRRRWTKALDEDLPVILITGYPEIRGAVAAMRAGAHDCLAKPLKHHEVLRVVFRALNERALKHKLRRLSCQIGDESSLRESMGPSNVVRLLIADVNRVSKLSVLASSTAGVHTLPARSQRQSYSQEAKLIPSNFRGGKLTLS
jgi:DNA-binding NtrC family response regulator